MLPFKTIDEVLQENARNVILVKSLRSQLASKQTTLNEVNNTLIQLEGVLDLTTTKLESKEDLLVDKEKFITALSDDKSLMTKQISAQSDTISEQVNAINLAANEAASQNSRLSNLQAKILELKNSKFVIHQWHYYSLQK